MPVIEGQELFAPMITIMGLGLSDLPQQAIMLPDHLVAPTIEEGMTTDTYTLIPVLGEVPISFEPFSRTRYYRRQREYVILPADGTYWVAVWDAAGETER